MLSFLPVLGPILQGLIGPLFTGVSDILGKYWGSKVETAKVAADVVKTETVESNKTLSIFEKDWGVRLARDIVILPWSLWLGGYGWDTFVAIRWPQLMIHIADTPAAVSYIPYAVLVFLLGNIGLNMFNRK